MSMNPPDDNPIQTLQYWKERAKRAEAAQKAALHTPKNGFVGEIEPVVGYPEREANVRLIAAAPDLYEFAMECANDFDDRVSPFLKDKARRLLAQVKGQP